VEPVPVPRAVAMIRLPAQPLSQVLLALLALPPRGNGPQALRPYLEVSVLLAAGETQLDLRRQIEEALTHAEALLLKLTVLHAAGDSGVVAHGTVTQTTSLRDLDPEEVLLRLYRRSVVSADAQLPDAQRRLFARLLEYVRSTPERTITPPERPLATSLVTL
jgi:DNA repair protein SbcD/Mre11